MQWKLQKHTSTPNRNVTIVCYQLDWMVSITAWIIILFAILTVPCSFGALTVLFWHFSICQTHVAIIVLKRVTTRNCPPAFVFSAVLLTTSWKHSLIAYYKLENEYRQQWLFTLAPCANSLAGDILCRAKRIVMH